MSNIPDTTDTQRQPGLGFSLPSVQGQSATLKHFEALKLDENPYEAYRERALETESEDDGIQMDVSPCHSEAADDNSLVLPMPPPQVLLEQFEEFLEVNSPLRDSEEDSFRRMSNEQKWRHLEKQQAGAAIYDAHTYITQLRQYGGANKRRWSLGRSSKESLSPLSSVLRKLKADLHMADSDFLQQFISCGGTRVLCEVLKELQTDRDRQAAGTAKKAKSELYQQYMQDEYDCLLCIKFTRKLEESLQQLINMESLFDCVLQCLHCSYVKTRIVTLQILCSVCDVPGGFNQLIEALSRLSRNNNESVRFQTLVTLLNKKEDIRFQMWCVRFFNILWKSTQLANAKVYLQYEIEKAGFDPDKLYRYGIDKDVDFVETELEVWRENYINVTSSRQQIVELENRNTYLRQEIDRQNLKIQDFEHELEQEKMRVSSQQSKIDEYRVRAAELQDTVEKLTSLYKDKTGEAPDASVRLDEATRPLDIYGTIRSVQFKRSRAESLVTAQPTTSTAVPNSKQRGSLPLPPVPPPNFRSNTVGRKFVKSSHANLPLFHFVPLHTITDSMFEDIDDEQKLREIDFSEFEEKFQLTSGVGKSGGTLSGFQRMIKRTTQKITFINVDRAKNMIITQRRVGLPAVQIAKAIDVCDINDLPGEMAEELIKYIPTKQEINTLSEYSDRYSELGEAEQFLFQLMQIERLEAKLQTVAFMGMFEELSTSVSPDIDLIYRNSQNVLQCTKLKTVFEIILAFGNYMNSAKKNYCLGFKLETLNKLSDIKSAEDKSYTMLHYLEEFLAQHYPELHDFHEELHLVIEKGVSFPAIFADVVGLRKGLDLIKFEMDKQQENTILTEFYHSASAVVTEIATSFHSMEKVYEKLCVMFGENYKSVETEEIFGSLATFCTSFQWAGKENYKRNNLNVWKKLYETPKDGGEKPSEMPKSPANVTRSPTYSKTQPQSTESTTTADYSGHTTKSAGPTPWDKVSTPRDDVSTPRDKVSTPRDEASTPRNKVSSTVPTKFTFDMPQLKHVSQSVIEEPKEDHYKLNRPSTDYKSVLADVSFSKSGAYSPRMHPFDNTAMASSVILPKKVMENRRKLSENSSHQASAKASTSFSKVFPAVRKSSKSPSVSRKSSSRSTKTASNDETMKEEHKPIIVRALVNNQAESPRHPAKLLLPDKPVVRQTSKGKSTTSETTAKLQQVYTGSTRRSNKRKAPKPPAPVTPLTSSDGDSQYKPPAPVTPLTSSDGDSQYKSQVSQVLNELNLVLERNRPKSPTEN